MIDKIKSKQHKIDALDKKIAETETKLSKEEARLQSGKKGVMHTETALTEAKLSHEESELSKTEKPPKAPRKSLVHWYLKRKIKKLKKQRQQYFLELHPGGDYYPDEHIAEESQKELLDDDNTAKLLIKLAVPAMAGNLMASMYALVDSIFLGHFAGSEALAAIGVYNTINIMFFAMGNTFAMGLGPLLSISLGKKLYKNAKNELVTISYTALFVSTAVSIVFLIFLDPILTHIGAVPEIMHETRTFTRVVLFFGFVSPTNSVIMAILRSRGYAKRNMYVAFIGASLNIALDAVFIVWFKWGILGAAIATVTAQSCAFITSIVFVKQTYGISPFYYKYLKFDPKMIGRMFAVGGPSGLKLLTMATATLFTNRDISKYGVATLAAYGIVNRIVTVAFQVMVGANSGAQPIISYNYGARRIDRINRIIRDAAILMGAVGIGCTVVFMLLPPEAFRTFTPDKNIMEITRTSLRINESMFLMFSMFILFSTFTQAVGYITESWIVAVAKLAVNTPLYFILPRFWGVLGVWAVMPFTDFFSGLAAIITAVVVLRKIPKRWAEQDKLKSQEEQKSQETNESAT